MKFCVAILFASVLLSKCACGTRQEDKPAGRSTISAENDSATCIETMRTSDEMYWNGKHYYMNISPMERFDGYIELFHRLPDVPPGSDGTAGLPQPAAGFRQELYDPLENSGQHAVRRRIRFLHRWRIQQQGVFRLRGRTLRRARKTHRRTVRPHVPGRTHPAPEPLRRDAGPVVQRPALPETLSRLGFHVLRTMAGDARL